MQLGLRVDLLITTNICLLIHRPVSRSGWPPSEAVDRMTVTNYNSGKRRVPAVLIARLGKLLAQRQAVIEKLQPKVAAAGEAA